MAVGEANVDEEVDYFEYVLGFVAVGRPGEVVVWDIVKDRFHVAQMSSGGGSACLFPPFGKGRAKVAMSKLWIIDFVASLVHASQ